MDCEPIVKSQRKLTVPCERKMRLHFTSNSLKLPLGTCFYPEVSSLCCFPVFVTGRFLPGEDGATFQFPVWAISEEQSQGSLSVFRLSVCLSVRPWSGAGAAGCGSWDPACSVACLQWEQRPCPAPPRIPELRK